MPSYLKTPIYRNEALLRAVHEIACVCCGAWGYTQAAHVGGVAQGKGRGIKVSDSRIAALCCDRPQKVGCHTQFDQHKIDQARGPEFIAATYIALIEAGLIVVAR